MEAAAAATKPTASPGLEPTYFFNKLLRQNSTLHVFTSWDKTAVHTFPHAHTCVVQNTYYFWPSLVGVGGWRVSKFGIWRETLI